MNIKNIEYLRHLSLGLENEFNRFNSSSNLEPVKHILQILRETKDPLKDVYFISRVKKFNLLASYILFILKKLNTGEINFDTYLENYKTDKEFIIKEILNIFSIEEDKLINRSNETNVSAKKPLEDFQKPVISELDIGDGYGESLEKEFLTSDYKITEIKEGGLELLKNETTEITEESFNLPEPYRNVYDQSTHINIDNPFSNLPVEVLHKSSAKEEVPAKISSKDEKQFSEKKKKRITIDTTVKSTSKTVIETASKLFKKKKKHDSEKEEATKKILISTLDTDTKKENAGKTDKKRKKKQEETPKAEIRDPDNKKLSEEEENFKKYEIILNDSNATIKELLEKLIIYCKNSLTKSKTNLKFSEDKKLNEKEIKRIEQIIEESIKMEEYSKNMSFEVITNVYGTIKLSLQNILTTGYGLDVETLTLFVDAITLIKKLVMGDDYSGYENIVKDIEKRKQDLINYKIKKEKTERQKKEKEILEKRLGEKYSNAEQKKLLIQLKNRILDVENIFKSLNDIKEEFQVYEALRRLGNTIGCFKDIVKYSNELEIPKLAQLAEASYVFIKYVQNYRMNPFTEEVREVLKFIIINNKLVFIEKPTKDIDLFISYLNNPERIFSSVSEKYR